MKKCKCGDYIDDYLLNKLSEEDKKEFEEHYFNCEQCFEKMETRAELIAVVKNKGKMIFEAEEKAEEKREVFSFDKVFSFFTPKQWAVATAAVALLLVFFLSVVPLLRKTSPQFVLDEEGRLRGKSIALISPVIDVETTPSEFKWKKLGENAEYKIYFYLNHEPFWTASTKETTLSLPEEIKNIMQAGLKYSWQVKAFSPQGTLIAVSSKVQFEIAPAK